MIGIAWMHCHVAIAVKNDGLDRRAASRACHEDPRGAAAAQPDVEHLTQAVMGAGGSA